MEMVNVKINGREYSVPQNSTVLEAARYAGVEIPTLCYLKDINEIGACRLCLVEVKGARGLVTACVYPVNEGMEIVTNSQKIIASYNGGLGHVFDAMALAEKYGKNKYIWDDNVADFILLKSNEEYFNDPVCKNGYFRGRETFNFVKEILARTDVYKEKIKP